MTEYDYTIIGAGMAGLYCGLLLSLKYPERRVLILEKNNYIGGHSNTVDVEINNKKIYLMYICMNAYGAHEYFTNIIVFIIMPIGI